MLQDVLLNDDCCLTFTVLNLCVCVSHFTLSTAEEEKQDRNLSVMNKSRQKLLDFIQMCYSCTGFLYQGFLAPEREQLLN